MGQKAIISIILWSLDCKLQKINTLILSFNKYLLNTYYSAGHYYRYFKKWQSRKKGSRSQMASLNTETALTVYLQTSWTLFSLSYFYSVLLFSFIFSWIYFLFIQWCSITFFFFSSQMFITKLLKAFKRKDKRISLNLEKQNIKEPAMF